MSLLTEINEYDNWLGICWENLKKISYTIPNADGTKTNINIGEVIYNSVNSQHNLVNLAAAIGTVQGQLANIDHGEIIPERFKDSYVFNPAFGGSSEVFKAAWNAQQMKQKLIEFNGKGIYTISGNFGGYVNLSSIILDDVEVASSSGVFKGCDSLRKVSMNNLKILKGSFFKDSTKDTASQLSEISLAEATEIGSSCFENLVNLTSINIPKVQTIKSSAFKGCTSLRNIVLPSSLIELGSSIFAGCNLENLYIDVTNLEKMNAKVFDKASIQTIHITGTVTNKKTPLF